MTAHLVCLTVDTDPDGLSGPVTNRRSLTWNGLSYLRRLPHQIADTPGLRDLQVPITWFVRVDGQLRSAFGTPLWLLDVFGELWAEMRGAGHELGWHPHLYRQDPGTPDPVLITSAVAACAELAELWEVLTTSGFHPLAFRNGEGWHTRYTYATVERLGLACDSTVIPGRSGGPGHPMKWRGAPNEPYFPDRSDLRRSGPPRPMLEVPITTWLLRAPYDRVARRRYMNPAVHPSLFSQALERWQHGLVAKSHTPRVWVLILHPDDAWPSAPGDALYARSVSTLCANLVALRSALEGLDSKLEFVTISEAAQRWSRAQLCAA